MNKRAFEIQFHWIFILIAGAVILAFFFGIMQKQQDLSQQNLAITLSYHMDAIFTGAIESKGSDQPLVTPKPGIAFSCGNTCDCKFYIGGKGEGESFKDKLIFAPAFIKDYDAVAWTVEWKLPFRVANFLLLTNPGIKYYLVYDTNVPYSAQLYQRVTKDLPKAIVFETLNSPSYVADTRPEGYAHTRFIFLGTTANLHSLHPDFYEESISGVEIDSDSRNAIFYDKSDPDTLTFNQRKSLLAGDATVFAAFFAADYQMYDCVMKSAFSKLGIVAEVHSIRANTLDELDRPECAYDSAYLADVSLAAKQMANADALSGESTVLRERILGVQSELKRQNNNLLNQGCPELY